MPSQTTYKNTNFSNQNCPKDTPVFNPDSSGKEKDSETGYYYFGARYYNSDLSLWLSVDPMADKYPSLSPYNYCAWNPVKLVDPDGAEMDDWEINKYGEVVNRIKNNDKDAFYRVDDNGDRVEGPGNSVEFNYGTIESHKKHSFSYKEQKGAYDVFQVRGDDNGEKLFKFFANTVADQEMEVSHAKCGMEGKRGLNFVSTAHFKPYNEIQEDGKLHHIAAEPSMSYLFLGRLQYGYTIREMNHSHPLKGVPSNSDRLFADQIRDLFSAKHLLPPSFSIYFTKENRYIPY
ncbi:MAG: hypothetical protein J5711_07095 [Bacteroidales bacterium]|nr:hypothetical protein [Bacteroidales bacterium]